VISDSGNRLWIHFHEKMGFSQVGLIEGIGWKAGHWLDSVIMQRNLRPGITIPPQMDPD